MIYLLSLTLTKPILITQSLFLLKDYITSQTVWILLKTKWSLKLRFEILRKLNLIQTFFLFLNKLVELFEKLN